MTWYILCSTCGRKIYNTDARRTWDGRLVCQNDYEGKHPMLSFKPREGAGEGRINGDFTGHEDISQSILVCDVYTSMGVAGYGTAGCARSGTYNMDLSPLPSLTVVPVVENRIIP
jgi:hypothetical protein